MLTATRRLTFSAGHRLLGHEGGCRHIHGHNYVAYIHASSADLDGIGRVIDFSILKERVGAWIQENWDHAFILFDQDVAVKVAMQAIEGQKLFKMGSNPTAENMARYLLTVVCPDVLAGTGVTVYKVVIEETENCSATAETGGIH